MSLDSTSIPANCQLVEWFKGPWTPKLTYIFYPFS